MDISPVTCTNCHQVSSADDKTVWVCENCQTVNLSQTATVSSPASSTPGLDDAQATIDAAAAEAAKIVVK